MLSTLWICMSLTIKLSFPLHLTDSSEYLWKKSCILNSEDLKHCEIHSMTTFLSSTMLYHIKQENKAQITYPCWKTTHHSIKYYRYMENMTVKKQKIIYKEVNIRLQIQLDYHNCLIPHALSASPTKFHPITLLHFKHTASQMKSHSILDIIPTKLLSIPRC